MIRLSLSLSGRLVSKTGFESQEVVLGRDPSCDLVIDNLGVSRRHACVKLTDKGWCVEDMGSQNGVFVCGGRVRRHTLHADDEFSIGKYTVRFEELGSTVPAAVGAEPAPSPTVDVLGNPLSGETGDMTFALDRNDLEKILEKVRSPAPTAGGAPRLVRLKPKKPQMVVRLERNHHMAGTAKGCDVRLKGWFTPRRAAMFVQEGGRDMVISLSDATRVKVNGKKVDSRTLADGDRIKIGRNLFMYKRD